MSTREFIEKQLRPIFNDKESGSIEVLEQLKEALRKWAEAEVGKDALREIARESLAHLGHFAVVLHFLDQLLLTTHEGSTNQSVRHFLNKYDARWNQLADRHAKHLLSLQQVTGQTILLHSHSSSIVNLFGKLAERFDTKATRVFQPISHPGREGLVQGDRLAEQGWKVSFIEDAALGRMLTQCDYALLGSDVITASTFVNKIGSMPVTAASKLLQIPVYVLGDERKLVNEKELPEKLGTKLLNEHPKSDRELSLREGQSGLNYHFEHVPCNWINAFLLYEGIYSPIDLNNLASECGYSKELLTFSQSL